MMPPHYPFPVSRPSYRLNKMLTPSSFLPYKALEETSIILLSHTLFNDIEKRNLWCLAIEVHYPHFSFLKVEYDWSHQLLPTSWSSACQLFQQVVRPLRIQIVQFVCTHCVGLHQKSMLAEFDDGKHSCRKRLAGDNDAEGSRTQPAAEFASYLGIRGSSCGSSADRQATRCSFDSNSMNVAELLVKNGRKEAYPIRGGIRGKKG